MRRALRILGTALIAGGVLLLVWTVVVWRWQDPFTGLYTRYEQRAAARSYAHRLELYRAPHYPAAAGAAAPAGLTLAAATRDVRLAARRYRLASHEGEPIGRLTVERLGLHMILLNGTATDTLKKGPGRELETFMPGQGQLVYIAGHRTTYLAPFSHIDSLRQGDAVTLSMPYGTFVYRVTGHRIVQWNDLSVLRSRGREEVVLQACHPRFFASHRYIAYARLVRFELPGGRAYSPAASAVAKAA